MDGRTAAAVRSERQGALLLVIMAARPANALGDAVCLSMADALKAAADPGVSAVVICSDLAQFSAGLDLPETPTSDLSALARLCAAIENAPKPVVVALNGGTLGAGLELALSAHARVAQEAARLGFPEVSLGVVPRAGGTQRLPHLIGAEAALRVLLEPGPVTAAQALALGLVDEVVTTGLREAACGYALRLAEGLAGRPPRKTSDRREGFRDPKAYQMAIAAARSKLTAQHLPAAARAIDCVEAAQLLPLEQGLAMEALAYAELVHTPASQGLRHAMLADQRAMVPPATVAAVTAPKLATLAIWGGGDAAADVAIQALTQGLRVVLVEPARDLLVKTVERIATRQELAVSEGRLTAEAREADWARLVSTLSASALAGSDLILTTVEAMALPIEPDAPVLALGALRPGAPRGKIALHAAVATGLMAELSFTEGADPQVMACALALARRLGWRLVFTGPGGPIDQSLRSALSAAITGLQGEGVTRETISAALASFGVGLGPKAALPKPPVGAQEVLDACLAALANQGARLIGAGVARKASDIDTVAVNAGLFPRWQGGPMFWADQRGALVLRSDLRRRAEAAPQIYTPDPIFDRLIAEGGSFTNLAGAER